MLYMYGCVCTVGGRHTAVPQRVLCGRVVSIDDLEGGVPGSIPSQEDVSLGKAHSLA